MQASRLNPTYSQGFTLLEIMLVLALMGLVLATVVPSIMSGTDSAQRNKCENVYNQAIQVMSAGDESSARSRHQFDKNSYTFAADTAGDRHSQKSR